MGENLNILIVYTSEDTAILQNVVERLKPYGKDHKLTIWHEDPILTEQTWKPKNESHLKTADIFLLLVSDAFMHSRFIQQLEFKMVIDRYKAGESTVIPIILDKCPWDIDFRADDYNFNMNELGVLPEKAIPIKEWDSSEKAYNSVITGITSKIDALLGIEVQKEPKKEAAEKVETAKTEEQIALAFDEEKEAEEVKKRLEEAEANRKAQEQRTKEQEEAKSRAAEKQRLEAEANRITEQKRLENLREAERRADEQRLRKEAEFKRLEKLQGLKEEAEAERLAEEAQNLQEKKSRELEAKPKGAEQVEQTKGTVPKKRLLIGAIVAVLAIIVIWAINTGADKESESLPNSKATDVEHTLPLEETEIEPSSKEEPLSELVLGDSYEGGMIFSIDADGKTGKVVHLDDMGPMPWADAMIIHDQLGKGWRLPTLDELKILYSTLGQGASNTAEFANKLYWSATPYDAYQARLLQFRTGNTSYHYNKEAEHRKFLVRAIRDFTR